MVSRWKDEIRAEHVLPFFKSIADYEAHGYLVSYVLDLLRKVLTEQDIENIINSRYDNYIKSLYLYHKASESCDGVDGYIRALQYLEEALKCAPGNTTLLYFKALFKYHLATVMSMSICSLLEEAIKEMEALCELETT
jgi:hypothetical protein